MVLRALLSALLGLAVTACGGDSSDGARDTGAQRAGAAAAGVETRVALTRSMVWADHMPAFSATGTTDGDVATAAWHIDGLRTTLSNYGVLQGPYIAVDLGPGQRLAITKVGVYAASRPPSSFYYINWSDDGFKWQYADDAGFVVQEAGWNTKAIGAGSGAHRYWRILLKETQADTGPWMTELALWTDGTAPYLEHRHLSTDASQSGMPAWFPEHLNDGDPGTGAWHNDGAPAGAWVAVDFRTPRDIRQVRLWNFVDNTPPHPTPQYDVQWSDDALTWNTVGLLFPTEPGWNQVGWTAAGLHRHWRLRLQYGVSVGPWIGEWQWMGPGSLDVSGGWAVPTNGLAQAGLTGWQPQGVADDDTVSYGWHTDASLVGASIVVDLGTPVTVERVAAFRVQDTSGVLPARYLIEGSANGLNWEVGLTTDLAFASPGWAVVQLDRPVTYRYWRLLLLNTPGPGAWISELKFLPPAF